MIKRIFLDLDDVLNTFTTYALWRVGCNVTPGDYSRYENAYRPEWGFKIVDAANALRPAWFNKLSTAEFWKLFDRRAWADVPKSPLCDWLVKTSERLVGQENVFVLTKAVLDGDCLAGKFDWVVKNLPEWMHDKLITCAHKHVCAHESLLVDDNQDNVQEFLKAGGYAILFPRPWNDLHHFRASEFLTTSMKAHFPGIDFNRNSGRTKRMLDMAWECASKGESVVIVARNEHHAISMRMEYAREHGGCTNVKFVGAADPAIDLRQSPYYRGFRGTVLVDHAAECPRHQPTTYWSGK